VFIVVSRKLSSLRFILKNEESTHAITPDKMDRTSRIPLVIGGEVRKYQMPCPLTEEEATPTVPDSEKTN
jgi:hypothetical protein